MFTEARLLLFLRATSYLRNPQSSRVGVTYHQTLEVYATLSRVANDHGGAPRDICFLKGSPISVVEAQFSAVPGKHMRPKLPSSLLFFQLHLHLREFSRRCPGS
jgi:hypothetical protein